MNEERTVKSATPKELADMYQISPKTFRRWLRPFKKEIGKRQGRYFNARQIAIIFMRLGMPFVFFILFGR